MKTLTIEFNEAIVKKGEVFEISLPIGGFIGTTWKDIQVVKGEAALIKEPAVKSGGCMGPFSAEWSFRADKTGELEIVAKSIQSESQVFKIKVS